MVCINQESFLGHKKEINWVIYRDVDGPRVCDTEWSKSEREKKISYINTYNMKSRKMVRTCSVMSDSFSPYGL